MNERIQLRNMTKTIGDKAIIRNVGFSVSRGEIVAFLGQNGAGKTTTLKVAAGLYKADKGEISIDGTSVFISDDPLLYEELTVREYIQMMKELHRVNALPDHTAFRLQEELDKKIKELSLGNKKKVALYAALIPKPNVLLLDEFISGIDPLNMRLVKDLLRAYAAEGNAILLSTHQLSVAQEFCDSCVLIQDGRILGEKVPLKTISETHSSLEDYFIHMMQEEVNS
ncbi:ABC transporter ATP-binding protein [Rossellomorea marisflavi]|uniref:ABC transporter ATP-binding protein n=1 Tax=Rossellomorea marisflavi TaxID=189381 RepID=UPI00279D09A9|nr:ABC transporter ATP-binding protein [Rossellomorea marisflavi]UTE73141.1 ABC transporter ATP-binding protein [Rossellomorea marisflavi]